MMTNPLVSIIMPVYNTPIDHLRRAMDSVLSQTYEKLELIVVIDGCEEGYCSQVHMLCERDSRIGEYRIDHAGVSAARNCGVTQAVGDYVMFMDSDDEMPDFAVEHAVRVLLENDLDIAFGLVEYRMEKVSNVTRPVLEEGQTIRIIEGAASEDVRSYFFSQELPVSSPFLEAIPRGLWAQIMSTTLAKSTSFDNDIVFMEDSIFNAFAVSRASRIGLVDEVWYVYHQNAYSVCNKLVMDESYDAHMNALAKYRGFDEGLDNDINAQICHFFFRAFSNESKRRCKGRLRRMRKVLNNPLCANAFKLVQIEGFSMSRMRRMNYWLCKRKLALAVYLFYSLRGARDRLRGDLPCIAPMSTCS